MSKAAMNIQDHEPSKAVVDPIPKPTTTELVAESEELSTSDESGQSDQQQDQVSKGAEQQPKEERRKFQSLAERGQIPNSLYVSVLSIGMLQGCSGMYKLETLESWWSSFSSSLRAVHGLLEYEKELMESVFQGEYREPMEYVRAAIVTLVVGSILWVLIGKPLSAGLWTGERAKRHKLHRYMGLFFLIQYTLAWVEFLTDYDGAGKSSLLPHTVALNGVIQGYSAYFSFKVLPQLKDPGYYSDKGVMSRDFLHENVCFNVLCAFGSLYNNSKYREVMQSNVGGKIMEYIIVFFPFVAVRSWFPITRLKNAGTKDQNRTKESKLFYSVGTWMVKIFYLWAKYCLGFQLNMSVFLGLIKPDSMKYIQGMILLNTGTVAIAMFLHTLRFRKILPGKFTFGFYLAQIYG